MEDTLITICDWSRPENIAIEYHNSKTILRINYSDLKYTIKMIESSLNCVKSYGFIGINNDVKKHCVPGLILGIQARGCGFVNLPSTNNKEICSKLEISFVFSECMIPDADLVCELDIHSERVKLLKYKSITASENNLIKDKFAYAITTSGSTGESKIIKVSHACIVPNILDLKKILSLSRVDKIAQLTTLTFDPSIVEIFLSLSSGSTLLVVSNDVINSPNELLQLIFQHKVSLLQTTPSLWRYRWSTDEIKSTILSKESHLKTLLIGGEPFPKLDTFRDLKHPDNQTKIYNIYGITEVSCWASINEINLENSDHLSTAVDQNLGKTLSQTIFQVRNKKGDVIRNGEGILYIGSDSRVCVIDREDFTCLETPVFRNTGDLVTINGDALFYKDRSDRTVKRFGNRMDLSELETAVLNLNFVRNCLALWDEERHKLYLCVSTICPKQIGDKFMNDLRSEEEVNKQIRKLPSFYQPDRIRYLANFRLNVNGKICKRTLMKIFQNAEEYRPENGKRHLDIESVRELFAKIWKNHLTLTTNYGFLENGGTSVIAMQISNELSVALDKEFPELIGMLLKNETFINCVDYIFKNIQCFSGDIRIEDSDSNPGTIRLGVNKKQKYDLTYLNKASESDTCVWQKCRGNMTGDIGKTDTCKVSINSKLKIEYTRDLRKCVDASPTIFGNSSGEIYTSVGSHAGVILTKQLNHRNSNTYEVHLPDRIEASVLALNDFKGVVGCYDGYVYCLHLKTGRIIWKFKTGEAVKCTAVLSNDEKNIFVGSYDKYFYSISLKDGIEMWKLKGSQGSISAAPRTCARSHSVVFGTLDGTCMSLNQSSGQIIWRTKFQDPVFSAPGVLENGDIVFCSVSGEVNCFNSETGRKTWRYKIDGNVFSHLVVNNNLNGDTEDVIIGCNNRNVYCLAIQSSISTPILRYSVTFECPIFATPYCEGDVLVVIDTSGNISLLNSCNGELLNSLKLNGDVFSSPVINGEFLVVGCRDNKMYVIRIDE